MACTLPSLTHTALRLYYILQTSEFTSSVCNLIALKCSVHGGTTNYPVGRSSQYSRGVVGEVEKETHILHGAVLLKVLFEESSRLHVNLSRESSGQCEQRVTTAISMATEPPSSNTTLTPIAAKTMAKLSS